MVKERPVTHKEFKAVLRHLGYEPRPQRATSHEHWVLDNGALFRKVTLDEHNAPYHRRVLGLMLNQAGLSKSEFFKLLDQL